MDLSIQLLMTLCSKIKNKLDKECFEISYTKYTLEDFECINLFSPTFSHIAQ